MTNAAVATALAPLAGFTGSISLLGATLLAGACTGVQVIGFWSYHRGRRARRSLPPRHPSGYRRERTYWSLAAAVLLFGMVGAFLVPVGAGRLADPSGLLDPEAAVAVAVAAVLVKTRPLARAAAATDLDRGATGWRPYLRHTRRPERPALLIQEAVSTLGVAVVAVAVAVSAATGEPGADAVGALVVAGVAAAAGAAHMVQLRELVAGQARTGHQQGITAAVEVEPCVARVVHLETHVLGPDELLVGAKVRLVDGLDSSEVADALQRIESSIRRTVPAARAVYLQPDLAVTTLPRDLSPPPLPAGLTASATAADQVAET